jgi:hypothetical protein
MNFVFEFLPRCRIWSILYSDFYRIYSYLRLLFITWSFDSLLFLNYLWNTWEFAWIKFRGFYKYILWIIFWS